MTKEQILSHFRGCRKTTLRGATGKEVWVSAISILLVLLHSAAAPAAKKKSAAESTKKSAVEPASKSAAAKAKAKKSTAEPVSKVAAPDESSAEPEDEPESAARHSDAQEAEAQAPPTPAETEVAPQANSFESALLTAFVALDFGGRQMHYTDRITNGNLRPYDLPTGVLLPVAPGLAASAEVFPLASKPWAVARDIGLTGKLNYNLANSKVGTVTVSTTWFAWELNLRGRLLLGAERTAPVIGIEVGTGQQAFKFHAPDTATELILPSVDYHYLRVGADGRIPIASAAVLVGLGYRGLSSSGQLSRHFPNLSISGLDLKIGGALQLTERFEARLVFNYARYSATLNAKSTDVYQAKSAVDQILNVDLGVAAHF